MPKSLILISVGLLLGAWFLIDEKRSSVEKFFILAAIMGIYVGFRLITGATMDEILAPLLRSDTPQY